MDGVEAIFDDINYDASLETIFIYHVEGVYDPAEMIREVSFNVYLESYPDIKKQINFTLETYSCPDMNE